MRNGTQSKLTLVDTAGHAISSKTTLDDVSVEYDRQSEPDAVHGSRQPAFDPLHSKALFIGLSIAFAAASIASASYAVWLSRSKATAEALTDVKDLLDTCEHRMRQMQTDLSRLPSSK